MNYLSKVIDHWIGIFSQVNPDDTDYTNYSAPIDISQSEDSVGLDEESTTSYLYVVQMFHFEIFGGKMPYILGVYSNEQLADQEGEAESVRVNGTYIPFIKRIILDQTTK